MERIRALATRQLGPLPLWAWAIGALAVLGFLWYFKRSGALGVLGNVSPIPAGSSLGASTLPPDTYGSGGGAGASLPSPGVAPTVQFYATPTDPGYYYGTQNVNSQSQPVAQVADVRWQPAATSPAPTPAPVPQTGVGGLFNQITTPGYFANPAVYTGGSAGGKNPG